MSLLQAFSLILLSLLVANQQPDATTIVDMVKRLGSEHYQAREAATKWLLDHEEAAPQLREALQSADREVARRAGLILEHYDKRPLRDLQAAASSGGVARFVELLVGWPAGKHEEGVWQAARDFAVKVVELHNNGGVNKINLRFLTRDEMPALLIAERITENPEGRTTPLFARAKEVLIEKGRGPGDSMIVASRAVRLRSMPVQSFLLARSSVTLSDGRALVVVAGGDVHVEFGLEGSLIIAGGEVRCGGPLSNSRIISGKSVTYNKREAESCQITENEPNPLGFIRFVDTTPPRMPEGLKK
jgi:hypothetical protein